MHQGPTQRVDESRTATFRLLALSTGASLLLVLAGCEGCGERPPRRDPDAGIGAVDGTDGGLLADAGGVDAGSFEDDGGFTADSGPSDGGLVDGGTPESDPDAGALDAGASEPEAPPFDWQDIFGDAGVPEELECIPADIPGFSITEILASFDFYRYTGTSEPGVVCGDEVCSPGTPCCELCGYAQCAPPEADGSPGSCPALVRSVSCDGHEDCPNDPAADTCCYTLGGTECRAEADCSFELPFGADGGFSFLPFALDGGPGGFGAGVADGGNGVVDGGEIEVDAGEPDDLDAGIIDSGVVDVDAGVDPGADVDAGAPDAGQSLEVDAGPPPGNPIGDFLDQGFPVCRNSLFDCDLLSLEVCCSSERIVAVDLGMCLPALVCFNDVIP